MHRLFSCLYIYIYLVTNLLLKFLLYNMSTQHLAAVTTSISPALSSPEAINSRAYTCVYLGLFSGSLNLGQSSAGVVLNVDISG